MCVLAARVTTGFLVFFLNASNDAITVEISSSKPLSLWLEKIALHVSGPLAFMASTEDRPRDFRKEPEGLSLYDIA